MQCAWCLFWSLSRFLYQFAAAVLHPAVWTVHASSFQDVMQRAWCVFWSLSRFLYPFAAAFLHPAVWIFHASGMELVPTWWSAPNSGGWHSAVWCRSVQILNWDCPRQTQVSSVCISVSAAVEHSAVNCGSKLVFHPEILSCTCARQTASRMRV